MTVEAPLARWFSSRGWTPFPFQRRTWELHALGRSGLVHVPTGAGKTYAALGGPLARMEREGAGRGVRMLYVSPLRAVSNDVELAIRAPLEALGLPLRVGSRTGDTPASERRRQESRMPEILVTTPESLTLLICRPDAAERLALVGDVVVDEWHELMSSKRGVQVELALGRLRALGREVRTWALSATLGRPAEAAARVVGADAEAALVCAEVDRPVLVESLRPASVERMPWSGHLGVSMLEPLLEWLDPAVSTLIFTNTRSQAERWFSEILRARPEWGRRLALHHGSIDGAVRRRVESGIKEGSLGIVVATSSLDLGVDFGPVERVVQIGSPKGVARLLQRAGRSGHRPGAACRVLCVPTHAMELVEIAAARQAVAAGQVEARPSAPRALDCLVQHMVTVALGGGFQADSLLREVRGTVAFRDLSQEEFDWCLSLAAHGGRSLSRYPRYHRIAPAGAGWTISGPRAARQHRLDVGTITAEDVVEVRKARGGRLGFIEEEFVARLRPGDAFLFAGKALRFERLHERAAYVRPAKGRVTFTPRWAGSRFPLSTALAAAVRSLMDDAARGRWEEPEMETARPILEAQAALSRIPRRDEILAERTITREGHHLFVYPFEGRLVHEGLASLLALRLGRRQPCTFAVSFNDYGLELLSAAPFPAEAVLDPSIWSQASLVEDLRGCVNLGQLGVRQFREIARVAGLVPQRPPGDRRRQAAQAGPELLYEVFREFEPDNLLLKQAEREVMDRQFEESRLARTLDRLAAGPIRLLELAAPGPLALPLVADRLGTTLSTETLAERLAAFAPPSGPRSAPRTRRRRSPAKA